MIHKLKLNIFPLVLLALYHILFWQQQIGINLPLFTLVSGLWVFWSYKGTIKDPLTGLSALVLLVTGVAFVWVHSVIAGFTHILSWFIFSSAIILGGMRSPFTAATNTIFIYFNGLLKSFETLPNILKKTKPGRIALYIFKIAFFPSFFILLFLILYSISSEPFGNLVLDVITFISHSLESIFKNINIAWMIFIAAGWLLIQPLIPSSKLFYFWKEKADTLFRKRRKHSFYTDLQGRPVPAFSLNGLKKELQSGIFLILSLNLLLFIMNFIEVKNYWFNFEVPLNFSLKSFVHESTGYLIFSILLSMAILLYYFRGNLNFFSKSKSLKALTYFWISQNLVLCISVFLRNYHYIGYHGLAYRRIGIIFFLALTAFGLITLFIKIKQFKSVYYLLRTNSYACLFALTILSVVNWDKIIVEYNLYHPNGSEIDTDFYLELSPQVLPLLYEKKELIKQQIDEHVSKGSTWVNILNFEPYNRLLDNKVMRFKNNYNRRSWQSFNVADYRAFNKLNKMQIQTP